MRATKVFGSFAVDDVDAATRFYRDVLGLQVSVQAVGGSIWLHGGEGHDTLVYAKHDHVPASFTVLNLFVEDLNAAVQELAASGVTTERYEGFEQDDRGIFHGEGHSVAWITDPAGNVVAIGHQS